MKKVRQIPPIDFLEERRLVVKKKSSARHGQNKAKIHKHYKLQDR